MRFDVYGRFQIEIVRESGRWVACRLGSGIRRREAELVIPAALSEQELAGFLDDVYHELARPGQRLHTFD